MKPIMQWAVGPDDGRRVRDVLERLYALGAPRSGRVFVNGRRADPDDLVEQGDRVELYPRRTAIDPEAVDILAQRDGIVLAYKPAGMPTETTRLGEDSLLSVLMQRLSGAGVRTASRLDVQVSGLVVCTLGKNARKRLESWRAAGQLKRTYVAIAHGTLEGDEGRWNWPLGKVRDRAGRHKVATEARELKSATTRFTVVGRALEAVRLELRPVTGRMHQLRAHAARAGVPFYGDRTYGGPVQRVAASGAVTAIDRIMLHAASVELPTLRAEAPLPAAMSALWDALSAMEGSAR